MKQDFTNEMIYDETDSQTQITTNQQFTETDLTNEKEDLGDEDAVVQIESVRTQVMGVENFVHMFNNKVQSIDNIDEQIQGVKDGIDEYVKAYEDEMELMEILDKEKKSDTSREPVPANSLTQHHMEAYKKIQNEKQQVEDLKENREQIMNQIEDLWPTVQELFDEGQPVPEAVRNADFLDTTEWEDNKNEGGEVEEIEEESEE